MNALENCTVVINIVRKTLTVAFKDWALGQGQQRGGGVRVMEVGRWSKGPLGGRNLRLTSTWTQVVNGKEVQQ